jgi:titin
MCPAKSQRPRAGTRRFRPYLELLEDRQMPSVYLVTNTNNAGDGSLRQAILNANSGHDSIRFDIEPGGPQTIILTSPLPTLVDPVTIDGTSQPGWKFNPLITIDGQVLDGYNGLSVTADGCKVKGLVLQNFTTAAGVGLYSNNNVLTDNWLEANAYGVEVGNAVSGNLIGSIGARNRNVISGNTSSGVYIHEQSTSNFVVGNYIGTDASGGAALANPIGVDIADVSSNNTVGGTALGAGNLISGNSAQGILIEADATANLVKGNKIGTNAAGTGPIANGAGIQLDGSSNAIGGMEAGARNVVSGNGTGVIVSAVATLNQVQGNFIGTNPAGTAALGNAANGLDIIGSNNTVGANGAPNIISGNCNDGVLIEGTATGNTLRANYVGTNAAGTAALGNGANGVDIFGPNNSVGFGVISGNANAGVFIEDGAQGVTVQGNYIGTNAAGKVALPNKHGVYIVGSNNSVGSVFSGSSYTGTGNVISGNASDGVFIASGSAGNQVNGNTLGKTADRTAALANGGSGIHVFGSNNLMRGNAIAYNHVDGVFVDAGSGNTIIFNNIHGNVNQSIELNSVDNADNLQSSPTLISVTTFQSAYNGYLTVITGQLISRPSTTFGVDLYAFFPDLSDNQHLAALGKENDPFETIQVTTDKAGHASFSVTVRGKLTDIPITATATNKETGDTSAYSLSLKPAAVMRRGRRV